MKLPVVLVLCATVAAIAACRGKPAELAPSAPSVTLTIPAPATTLPTTSTTTTTTARPATTSPPPAPTVATTAPAVPTAERPSPAGECEAALADVQASGLRLPPGWGYRCPDPALDYGGQPHAGVACWVCRGGAESYIAVNPSRAGSGGALRGVVAHEVCHAVEFAAQGWTTEASADTCAADHGWPNPFAAAEGEQPDAFGPLYTPAD
ncbi:MAG: hypothetical protein ACRD2W_20830 [Acidimicrobiales bacterium]